MLYIRYLSVLMVRGWLLLHACLLLVFWLLLTEWVIRSLCSSVVEISQKWQKIRRTCFVGVWKNLHRHMKMMPFSVRLTFRWVLTPRFSCILPRLGPMIGKRGFWCVMPWLSMWTICFTACLSLSRWCGKISENLSESPWKSPKIVSDRLQFPQKSPSDACQKPPRSPTIWSQNYAKLSREPPEIIPNTRPPQPVPTRSWPAQDPQNRR